MQPTYITNDLLQYLNLLTNPGGNPTEEYVCKSVMPVNEVRSECSFGKFIMKNMTLSLA